ncbi:hypothetical protein ACFQZQ_10940 [Lysobacter koreensis]|uniref:Uncharacterized protein n=1 Tax=Lysobacter koreensis TaxID=266122 RepID=A0ABW2YN26_9GAMM
MNADLSLPTLNPTASAKSANVVAIPTRHVHRERDFGIGYGNSSGYASQRRYVSDWAQPRFRCA